MSLVVTLTPPVWARRLERAWRSPIIALRVSARSWRIHHVPTKSNAKDVSTITMQPAAVQSGHRSITRMFCIVDRLCSWIAFLMVASSSLDAARKLCASFLCSLKVNSSICFRSASNFALNRSLKVLLVGPPLLIDRSFQPEFIAALRIERRHVILALPVDLQARVFKAGNKAGAVMDGPGFDLRHDIPVNSLAALKALHRPLWACLKVTGAFRVIWPRPTIFKVQRVPERIVEFLPAGGSNVQSLAGRKLHARRHEMQFHPPARRVLVTNPEDIILIGFQPCEGRSFELVHHLLLLRLGGRVPEGERDYPGRVAPFPVDAVDKFLGALRVPAYDFRRRMIAAFQIRAGRILDRATPAALPAGEKFNQHPAPSRCCGARRQSRARSRRAGR
ncbi:hypothetical protein [Phyllobacterium leguminum]|uniref:hypothetical protein n=1 Tax=Phyllobacterium leguminum TaxID=314237 RepID=UPI001FE0666D|nr:hypothetical protein [Phyllobacterium leguminum]